MAYRPKIRIQKSSNNCYCASFNRVIRIKRVCIFHFRFLERTNIKPFLITRLKNNSCQSLTTEGEDNSCALGIPVVDLPLLSC